MTTVEMPQLGNTVEECLITRWVKQKGDAVSAGEVVAEIETDKTTFEVTAPIDGTVLETFGEAGSLVAVFTKLFVIGDAGESLSAPLAAAHVESPEPPVVAKATAGSQAPSPKPRAVSSGALSPRARKFAAQHNFEPGSIAGTGPGGRVLEHDVRKAYESAGNSKGGPASLSITRQVIARRMKESLASTAQYTLHASANAAALLAARARYKMARPDAGITINDLVAACTIQALLQAPEVNAEFIDGRVVRHAEVHLGFACDTTRGLMAPVVRDAHTLSIGELSERMKELSTRAIEGTIQPSDLSGATFSISNLGSLGIEMFTPVLNPPQVAILGVGAIHVKPVRAGGGVEFIDAIGFSLTCDHQVIDGAPGARFLRVLREKIETCPNPSS